MFSINFTICIDLGKINRHEKKIIMIVKVAGGDTSHGAEVLKEMIDASLMR